MPNSTAPNHSDFASQLTADAYSQLIRTLRMALPPPLSDSPEDLARRDHSAIARIAALIPANAAEADLAALHVAAFEQVKECLRLAQQPDISADWAMKCRAQANSMMRQGQSALGLLLRLQAAREKREANSAANERAAWTEHCAIRLMAQALSPEPEPMVEPLAPEPCAEPEPVAQPRPEPAAAEEGASTDPQGAVRLGPHPVRFANRPRIESGAGSLPKLGEVGRDVRYTQAGAADGTRLGRGLAEASPCLANGETRQR